MLVVQWLRICLPMQGHGLIPGRGTKIPHASGQVYRHTATRESLHATTKIQCGQKRKKRKGEVKHISQFSGSVASDALQASGLQTPGFPVHHQLPELAETPVHRVCDAIQQSHALSSPSPPAFNLSQHQGLYIRWPKCWSFNISPSNEYSGLISF